MRVYFFVTLWALGAATATFGKVKQNLSGVWTGTLGNKLITACFLTDNSMAKGSYYYRDYLDLISLTFDKDHWIENESKPTGSWIIDHVEGTTLSGTWSSPDKVKKTKISLRRSGADGQNDACGSDAFNLELEKRVPEMIEGKVEQAHGLKFRRLHQFDENTLEIIASGKGVAKINSALRKDLRHTDREFQEFYENRRSALGSFGFFVGDETIAEIEAQLGPWVTVYNYKWTAGYGRNGIVWGRRTWNLETGERLFPWAWFGVTLPEESLGMYGGYAKMPRKLQNTVYRRAGIDLTSVQAKVDKRNEGTDNPDDCVHTFKKSVEVEILLNSGGVKFSKPAFGDGCDFEVFFTFKDLEPFVVPNRKGSFKAFVDSVNGK